MKIWHHLYHESRNEYSIQKHSQIEIAQKGKYKYILSTILDVIFHIVFFFVRILTITLNSIMHVACFERKTYRKKMDILFAILKNVITELYINILYFYSLIWINIF